MVFLTREQLEAEILAVSNCIGVHEMGLKMANEGILVNSFLKELLEKELKKLPTATIKPKKEAKSTVPIGVG